MPAAARFGAQRPAPDLLRVLGRADIARAGPGRRAQLARQVDLPAGAWPMAALSRQVDAGDGDAADSQWLRADPAWLRPDINGVRLMAHGETLGLTRADCDALLPALKPLFGDAGFRLDAPVPSRWYLRLPRGSRLPAFPDPAEALGTDLSEHDGDDGMLDGGTPEARRWRMLASEAQIILHNHPWNAARAVAGRAPVNALWFWGGGAWPDAGVHVRSRHGHVYTVDPTCQALAAAATDVQPLPPAWPGGAGDALFDLAGLRDLRQLETQWLRPALAALGRGELAALELDDEDGRVLTLARWHRLRIWRRPLAGSAA
nr:phosphoglycerate mutase [Luteimonas sp. BDR2-5]